MSIGAPSLATNQRRDPTGAMPPFNPLSANNGLSVSPIPGKIVLGQDVGQVGSPADYLSDRELPNQGFHTRLLGAGRFIVSQTPAINTGESIQADAGINIQNGFGGTIRMQASPVIATFIINNPGVQIQGSDTIIDVQTKSIICQMTDALGGGFFDIRTAANAVRQRVQQNGNVLINSVIDNGKQFQVNGSVSFNEAAAMLHAVTAMTNGAGASVGTLTNSPAAGNPTKWIPFDDAGVTRFIPSW